MSSYKRTTRHPIRNDWQWATWHDNMFGEHNYGVTFPSDEHKLDIDTPLIAIAYDPRISNLKTRE